MAEYKTGLLTYVDILGFRDLIEDSKNDPNTITQISNILFAFEKQFTTGGRVGVDANNLPVRLSHFYNFSDLMLRVTLVDENADLVSYLNWELLTLAHRQMLVLWEESALIRGAVTLDRVFSEDKFIFGPAVVKGYEMERDLAVYPRIVLDEKLMTQVTHFNKDGVDWQYIALGEDGVQFVDYLVGVYLDIHNQKVSSAISPYTILEHHKRIILQKLNALDTKDMKRKAKVWWMWQYHNAAITRLQVALRGNQEAIEALDKYRLISR